jgi:Na+/H+-dicarboxylate symporter
MTNDRTEAKMNVDLLSIAALATVLALFAAIFILRKKGADFMLVVIGALVVGIGVGVAFHGHTGWIMPIGKIYVTTLAAIVMPLIIVSILSSVTSLGSAKELRGIGARSVLYLILTNAIAIVLSIGIGLIFGVGKNSYLSIDGVDAANFAGSVKSFSEVLIGFFPNNVVHDISDDKIIPVILFTALIAISYVLVAGERKGKGVAFKNLVEDLKAIIYKAVSFIIELTPYAVLALVATAASNGLSRAGIIWSLLVLLVLTYFAMLIDVYGVNYVLLRVFAGVAPGKFFRKAVPPQIIGFSTQSSVGTLPVTIKALTEKLGVSPEVANFTAPLGTTIGMPGCAGVWPILVAIYGINGLGIHYSFQDYIMLAVLGLFVSLGTAGVPGTATIVTASVLTAVGLPLEIMVLSIPISAIADMGRTATNITGAMVSSIIVAKKEKDFDEDIYYDRRAYEEPRDDSDDGEKITDESEYRVPVGESCTI